MDIDNPPSNAKPCTICKHLAREHNRHRTIDGRWNGKCSVWDCDCPNYVKPN